MLCDGATGRGCEGPVRRCERPHCAPDRRPVGPDHRTSDWPSHSRTLAPSHRMGATTYLAPCTGVAIELAPLW